MPVILVQTSDNQKYLKSNVEPDHIAPWLKEYVVMPQSFFFFVFVCVCMCVLGVGFVSFTFSFMFDL